MARSFGIELETVVKRIDGTLDRSMTGEVFDYVADVIRGPLEELGFEVVTTSRTAPPESNKWQVKYDGSLDPRSHGAEIVSPALYGTDGERAVRAAMAAISKHNRRIEREGSVMMGDYEADSQIIVNRSCGHHMHHDVLSLTAFPSQFPKGTNVGEIVATSKKGTRILGNIVLMSIYWANCFDRLLTPSRRAGHVGDEWAGCWTRQTENMAIASELGGFRGSALDLLNVGWDNAVMYGTSWRLEDIEDAIDNGFFYNFDHWLGRPNRRSQTTPYDDEWRHWDFYDWGRAVLIDKCHWEANWQSGELYPSYQNWTRYSAGRANLLTSWRKYGTVEFRQHQGTLNAEKILQWQRLTQKLITIAYAPEHKDKLRQLAQGLFDPNSMEDFFDFFGMNVGARRFWAQRTMELHSVIIDTPRISRIFPAASPSRFKDSLREGWGRPPNRCLPVRLHNFKGGRYTEGGPATLGRSYYLRDYYRNTDYLNSLI